MKILIGSKNPGKIQGAKEAFEEFFENVEVVGYPAPSNVSEQPVNEEILLGAKNRAQNVYSYAKENNIEADYYVAVESGITNALGKWMITNIAYIIDKEGKTGYGTSASFPVPERYVDEIIKTDLGKVMDRLFDETDLRSGTGGIGLLTHGKVSRIDLTKSSFTMALTQFVNDNIWSNK